MGYCLADQKQMDFPDSEIQPWLAAEQLIGFAHFVAAHKAAVAVAKMHHYLAERLRQVLKTNPANQSNYKLRISKIRFGFFLSFYFLPLSSLSLYGFSFTQFNGFLKLFIIV